MRGDRKPAAPPTVLVTDAGYASGLTVVRSLSDAGYRVVATHVDDRPAWARSRFADVWATVPSPERSPGRYLDALEDLCRSERVDVVLPTTDKSIHSIDNARSRFSGAMVALPSSNALSIARNKATTTQLASELGIPVPRSAVVNSLAEARSQASALGWPVVLKPLVSHSPDQTGHVTSRSVLIVDGPELLAEMIGRTGSDFPFQIQEHLPGVGVGVEVLAVRGDVVHAFQHRRIHEIPLSGGMSSVRVAEEPDPVLLDHSRKMICELGWTGLAMIEFRVGPAGPILLEVNGRIWGSIALPVRAGMDFPTLLLQHLLPPIGAPASSQPVVGTRCTHLELELRWLLMALRDQLPGGRKRVPAARILRSGLALLDPRTEFDVQIGRDWRLGVFDLTQALHGLASELLRRGRDARSD